MRSFSYLLLFGLAVSIMAGCSHRGTIRSSESAYLTKEGAGLQSNRQIKRSYMAQLRQERIQTGECTCFTCLEGIVLARHPELSENYSVAQRKPGETSNPTAKSFELKEVVAYADSQVPWIQKNADSEDPSHRDSSRKPLSNHNVSVAKQVPVTQPSESYLGIQELGFADVGEVESTASNKPEIETVISTDSKTATRKATPSVRQETAVALTPTPNELVKFDLISPKADRHTERVVVAKEAPQHSQVDMRPSTGQESVAPVPSKEEISERSQQELQSSIQQLAKSQSKKHQRIKSTLTEMQSAISEVKTDLNQMRATLDGIPERIEGLPKQISVPPPSDVMIFVTQPFPRSVPEPATDLSTAPESDLSTGPVKAIPAPATAEMPLQETSPTPAKLVTTPTEPPIILRARVDERSLRFSSRSKTEPTASESHDPIEFALQANEFRPLPEIRPVVCQDTEKGIRSSSSPEEQGTQANDDLPANVQQTGSERQSTDLEVASPQNEITTKKNMAAISNPIPFSIPTLRASMSTRQIQPLPPIINITPSDGWNPSRDTQGGPVQTVSSPVTRVTPDYPAIRWEFPGQYDAVYGSESRSVDSMDRQAAQANEVRQNTARPVNGQAPQQSTTTIER